VSSVQLAGCKRQITVGSLKFKVEGSMLTVCNVQNVGSCGRWSVVSGRFSKSKVQNTGNGGRWSVVRKKTKLTNHKKQIT
jgi:hypothetical protein